MPDSMEAGTVGDLLDRTTPGIGHNQPPLAEVLVEESKALKLRMDDLIATAKLLEVTDGDSADRATVLVKMMKECASDIEEARTFKKAPVIADGRTIDGHYKGMAALLIGDDPKKLGGAAGPLDEKITELRKRREAEAAAERARLEEEARQQRELAQKAERDRRAAEEAARVAAVEAQRKLDEALAEAAAAGHQALADKLAREKAESEAAQEREAAAVRERNLEAEIEQARAENAAAELERRAADTKAVPIGAYGVKAGGRKKYIVVITDLNAAIKHCRKISEDKIREAVQAIYDKQANGGGVRTLPGATVTEDNSKTTYR